jgi:hypothetical protein
VRLSLEPFLESSRSLTVVFNYEYLHTFFLERPARERLPDVPLNFIERCGFAAIAMLRRNEIAVVPVTGDEDSPCSPAAECARFTFDTSVQDGE